MLPATPPVATIPQITGDIRMGDLIEQVPGARRALFARYHLGGCQSCAFSDDESLADLCRRADDLPLDEVVAHLQRSAENDQRMWIDPADLRDRLAGDSPPTLVDTRTREEHEAVALPGSRFLDQDLQQQLFAGDPARSIVLYDHSGRHVLDPCSWFHGHGLKATRALRGGIDAWSREIDPSLPRYRIEID